MREILFRGKDKDDGNWYEGYYLKLHDTTCCSLPSDNAEEATRSNKENEHHYIVFEQMTDWGLPNKHLRAEVLPETVCQYTGLTDKNGRKIFEGDIVSEHGNRYVVFWDECNCEIGIKNNVESFGIACVYPGDMKVIGNVFDNSELIENK